MRSSRVVKAFASQFQFCNTRVGSILASIDIVESEGRLITYLKKKIPAKLRNTYFFMVQVEASSGGFPLYERRVYHPHAQDRGIQDSHLRVREVTFPNVNFSVPDP
jgi:hypothetical protein